VYRACDARVYIRRVYAYVFFSTIHVEFATTCSYCHHDRRR